MDVIGAHLVVLKFASIVPKRRSGAPKPCDPGTNFPRGPQALNAPIAEGHHGAFERSSCAIETSAW